MSSQRPVYIPRRRKAVQSNSSTDPQISKNSEENNQTRRQWQKQQQPRFHGAFTGGFSAGYFNTVGTKEGWTPSQIKKKDQRLEDFMDDEDHADWGGPTRLRDEYGTKTVSATKSALKDHGDANGDSSSLQSSTAPFLPIKSMLEISHQTVGPRLLRRLGWREGGSAIVPENQTTKTSPGLGRASGLQGKGMGNEDNTLENLARVHLSRRKLRKIQLQSSRIKLPPPKLDQCGLGFEPYKDAPEFQRYREKRKQLARDRASYSTRENVYRISDVASTVDGNANFHFVGRVESSQHSSSGGGEYLSYETAEDFVGKRSASGFALRDDEDDAYDDDVTYMHQKQNGDSNGRSQSARLNGFKVGDEYNTEVYEHESSDDDQNGPGAIQTISRAPIPNKSVQSFAPKSNSNKSVEIGNMFAAWAGTDKSSRGGNSSSTPHATLTSDGQPPLAGFVLRDSMDINKRRYPGPRIPRDYTIERHEFGEHENPYVLEAISNAVRLEQKEERKSQMRQQQERQRESEQKLHESSRPLSNNFSSLAEAMKRRFTSSTDDSSKKGESSTETSKALPAGLHMPRPVGEKKDSSKGAGSLASNSVMPRITITRTVESFSPNPLLCKRFRVPMPTNVRTNTSLLSPDEAKNNESLYFEREILGKATQHYENKKMSVDVSGTQKITSKDQTNTDEEPKGIDRPSIENLRKIFQASSDESSSSEDDNSFEGIDKTKPHVDKSLRDNSSHVEDKKTPSALPSDDAPTKKASGSQYEEMAQSRSSLSQEDEVEKFASSDSDGESRRDKAVSSRKRRKEKHRRKHSHHRKRRKRKHSRSTDRDYHSDRSSSEEEEERRKERRSRDHEKKRKKKSSSSSRHKSRKRENADLR